MVGVIFVAAVLVGLETYPAIAAKYGDLFHILDKIVLGFFIVEIAVKLGAELPHAKNYFKDPWNVFDFLVVAICFIPIEAQFVAVLRLIRILRVLKLITAIPKLQMIVGALLKAIPSIGYIGMLLGIYFYITSVMATTFFGGNDPFHFGNLQTSFISLFQIVTMEGWADIMQIQIMGCDKMGYDEAIKHMCTAPSQSPVLAPAFFIIFIIVGTMIILNLFIGVIMKGMEEMQEEMAAARSAVPQDPDDDVGAKLSKAHLETLLKELDQTRERVNQLLGSQMPETKSRSRAVNAR
jgi:voltage-gated sodium channel